MPVTDNIISGATIQTSGSVVTNELVLNSTFAAPQAVATGTAVILIPTVVAVGGAATPSTYIRLTAAAATTGASLPLGTQHGQILIISLSTAAANTVTFAAAGTSFVAGGATVSLAGLASHLFIWSAIDSLWFQVGPATN